MENMVEARKIAFKSMLEAEFEPFTDDTMNQFFAFVGRNTIIEECVYKSIESDDSPDKILDDVLKKHGFIFCEEIKNGEHRTYWDK